MPRYPKAQRAIADAIEQRMKELGKKPADVNRAVGQSKHYMRRILELERGVSCHELIAGIGPALQCRGSMLLKQAEQRLKAEAATQRRPELPRPRPVKRKSGPAKRIVTSRVRVGGLMRRLKRRMR